MFDRRTLANALGAYDRVVRVVIAGHKGSTPRETGTVMLVHTDGIVGTIGGGRLEFEAITRARRLLADPEITGGYSDAVRQPLGPSLGQCCGGSVTVVSELWDNAAYHAQVNQSALPFAGHYVRRVEGTLPLPPGTERRLHAASQTGQTLETQLLDGWLIEPLQRETRPIFIYGAGHVGTALTRTLCVLPGLHVALVDPRKDLFVDLPQAVQQFHDDPNKVMATAPPDAFHYIMTPDHQLDLDLCHRVLQRPFAFAGLIGSNTKWARFRKRLTALGYSPAQIDRITCPIGDPALGKHPFEIAIGVARDLMLHDQTAAFAVERRA